MKLITARPHRLLPDCVRRIGEKASQGEPCMWIVPAQYTLQAEIEVMTRLNLPGSFLIDVLSPGRLQGRIFERAGLPEQTVFDERGKCMLLAALLEEEKDHLLVYRNAAQNSAPGLAAKMSSLIAAFKRSGKTPEEILLSAEMMDNGPARDKLLDAARIYAAYTARMAGELADAEDVSREMCSKMAHAHLLEGKHVFVSGFDVITPTFAEELAQIETRCASLTLFVETDKNAAPDGYLFAPVNLSIQRLSKILAEKGLPFEHERLTSILDVPDDLRLLESRLFALGTPAASGIPDHISLHAVSGRRQEVHAAAAEMRKLAQQGADCAQMAVVYPKESGYAPLIENILPMYGLKAYVAEKRPAGTHPLCRFVLSALNTASGSWKTSDVLECVQSGFMGVSDESSDALAAYCEGADVRGEALKKPFQYARGVTEEELKELETCRQKIAAPLLALQKSMNAAKKADDTVLAIIRLLEDVHAFDTLGDMRLALENAGLSSEAQDCAQVWNQLMETLDQLHTLLGGQPVPAKLMMHLLQNGLLALKLSALPPADGAIICGEIGNVRTAEVETLFALGMNDSSSSADDGLFTPGEQIEITSVSGVYMGMNPQERAALAQLDELKALSGAASRVYISYALADETGRALREGACVQALRRLFPDMPILAALPEQEREAMLCAPAPALEALAVHLSEAADGRRELDEVYVRAAAALDQRQMLSGITRRLSEPPERYLSASQARALYGRPIMSVSRIETFAQCPYRHFVRYGLVPEQEQKPGVSRAELGTLYHEAAERFTRAVTALPEFPNIPAEVCDRLMDEAAAPLIDAWRASPLGESARGASIARRVSKTARRTARNIVSQFAGSEFRPLDAEFVFGKNGTAPITLELFDGTFVYLQGRIDRVDMMDGRAIRIIDYKSGAKKFDPTLVYWGLQLQLLLYLSAALAQIPGAHPAGFFYCRIADPTIKTESRIKEEVEKQLAKKLSLSGISLCDIQILRAQGEQHAAMVTKSGTPNARHASSMVDEAGMDALLHFASQKASSLASQAYSGLIDDAPVEWGQMNACQTCPYAAVCGFDPTRKLRRRLTKKTLDDLKNPS